MNKDKYKDKTDLAWKHLYARLENDGLLENAPETKPSYVTLKWLVAAAAVVLAVIITLPYLKQEKVVRPLISQSNDVTGSTLVKTLDDGSIIYLISSAVMRYPSHFQSTERKIQLRGEALFDVAHDASRPFRIDTRDVAIQVLGTCFNVKSVEGKPFELGVYRGAVRVTDKHNGTVMLVRAGQSIVRDNGRLVLSNNPPRDSIGRYYGNIRFKDETLANIIRVINRNHTQYELKTTSSAASRRLTVAFAADTPPVMASLLSQALHLEMNVEGRTITIK